MARYVVYACEQMYGGLHGMNEVFVTEACSEADVNEIALDASYDVMGSYSAIYEDLENEIAEIAESEHIDEDDVDTLDELRDQVYAENVDYAYHLINEDVAGIFTTKQLDKMASDNYESFIETYCI